LKNFIVVYLLVAGVLMNAFIAVIFVGRCQLKKKQIRWRKKKQQQALLKNTMNELRSKMNCSESSSQEESKKCLQEFYAALLSSRHLWIVPEEHDMRYLEYLYTVKEALDHGDWPVACHTLQNVLACSVACDAMDCLLLSNVQKVLEDALNAGERKEMAAANGASMV